MLEICRKEALGSTTFGGSHSYSVANKKPATVNCAGFSIGTTEWIRTTDPHHVKVVL